MASEPGDLAAATRLVGLGRPPRTPGAVINQGVELTSTYVAGGNVVYARSGNPTWTAFEEVLGSLEGGRALAFASGMAAVAASLSLVPHGSVVVAPVHAYNGTGSLLDEASQQGRFEVRRVDSADTAAVLAAMRGAQLVWLESPTNPMLEVADLPALLAGAREQGAISVVDNTFATPLLQQPIALGADVVMHSATKFIAGHSDVLLGATVTADEDLQARLFGHRVLHGAIPGPFETWLALRGLRTLQVRLDRSCANAAELARRLGDHPSVGRMRYPGFGAIVSIEVTGGAAAASRVEDAVRIWTPATSLGGVESLIERRRRIPTEPVTVPQELLRLSVGLEDVEDLWRDLDAALRA
ncbi:PLP-dependent aspartate aminotransferase family protein [Allobranchiibius sp. GilTou73]|uniref:trans-sulfuration enzyme family protein n=1 Tax=Allobranchiibius sp. GilTou73 TaxID=2904523 RepID=UPI001F464B01|nr:PLP-dependent aspartate aminotransferase family protein [Allobranchiibius sp. GilTou73]UIJ34551.1 PLP-dependent aspartate aminotransferase family protein [Allobranchiibius sp. GilTou73]